MNFSWSKEVLVVGSDFANVFELESDGKFSGLAVNIINRVAKKNGRIVKFAMYPWGRAQLMVKNNVAHVLIGPYKTPERELFFNFSRISYSRDTMSFFVRTDSKIQWDGTLSKVKNKIGVIKNYAYGARFEQILPRLNHEMVKNPTVGLRMLELKRFELLAANTRDTLGLINKLGLQGKVKMIHPFISVLDGHFAFCKSLFCDKIREEFNSELELILKTQELKRLGKVYKVNVQ